ncbi:MAG: nucleotidyltransferase domain-containing protein [Candidatus Competibacteraceae bacterium]|nr:nucleotidyltransferase domain-containing protein [Candidatus Competibacteraceae bacterium]
MEISELDPITRQAVRLFLGRLEGQFDLKGALLFGSRARGEHHRYSDADLAVLLDGQPGAFLETKLAMADIAYDVLLETGVHIQPLPVWESEWHHPENYPNPRLLHNIAREGIRL